MNCHADSVARALSNVLLHRLVGLGPPHGCLLHLLWTASPWYLDAHIDIFTHSDSDPITAFVRATALISDSGHSGPINFEGVAAKLPELFRVVFPTMVSLRHMHFCRACHSLTTRRGSSE